MATRLLIQKFSRMSRSSSLLGAHASAAAPEGVFQGAVVHPGMTAPSKPAIHGYAARYFNILPCSHADAKTSLTTTGMPSTITNCMKPSFLDFSGVKKTFSSGASKSNNHKFATQAKMAALRAQDAACKPLSEIEQAIKDTDTTIALMAFTCLGILYMSANDNTSTDNGSSRCSNCCNCQCHGPNPKVQQD